MRRYMMPQPTKKIQNAKARGTEGTRTGEEMPASALERGASVSNSGRPRGRPKGSKNRPKGLISPALTSEVITEMQRMLPPEQFAYIKGVAVEGKPIETKNELSILILFLSRSLYPALVLESIQDLQTTESASDFFEDDDEESAPAAPAKPKAPALRKDVTERLKVLQSLLSAYEKIERDEKAQSSKQDTILTITANRNLDRGRLLALVGIEPGSVVGDVHGVVGEANEPRNISDQVVERPVLLQSGEQGETDRG